MITVYNKEDPEELLGYKLEPDDVIIMYHGNEPLCVPLESITESLCTGFTFQPTKG